jgi:hypothetical protein
MTMREFWDVHSYYSSRIIENERPALQKNGATPEEIDSLQKMVGAHHFLERNVLGGREGEIPGIASIWIELLDKLYACLRRSDSAEKSWKRAMRFLEDKIAQLQPESAAASRYNAVRKQIGKFEHVIVPFIEARRSFEEPLGEETEAIEYEALVSQLQKGFSDIDTFIGKNLQKEKNKEEQLREKIKHLCETFKEIADERGFRISDIYEAQHIFNRGRLFRRDSPQRLIDAAFNGKPITVDASYHGDSRLRKTNAADDSPAGFKIASLEGRNNSVPTVLISFSPEGLTVENITPPEHSSDPRDKERYVRCRAVTGTIRPETIYCFIVRIPLNLFPEEELTEKEKELIEEKLTSYIYRVVTLQNSSSKRLPESETSEKKGAKKEKRAA